MSGRYGDALLRKPGTYANSGFSLNKSMFLKV
jgi:hypothetical protein